MGYSMARERIARERIGSWIKSAGYTRAGFGAAIGRSQPYVSQLTGGYVTPSLAEAVKIAGALRRPIAEVVFELTGLAVADVAPEVVLANVAPTGIIRCVGHNAEVTVNNAGEAGVERYVFNDAIGGVYQPGDSVRVERDRQATDGNEVVAEWKGSAGTIRLLGVYRDNPPRLLPIGGGPATLLDDTWQIRGVVVSANVSRIGN